MGSGDGLFCECVFETQKLLVRKDPPVVLGKDSWATLHPQWDSATSSLSLRVVRPGIMGYIGSEVWASGEVCSQLAGWRIYRGWLMLRLSGSPKILRLEVF